MRLADAFKAHEDLRVASDLNEFESSWTRLLTALHSVYSILEQSVKGSSKSERWFAHAKSQRRSDEALAYLHQARNVNDHRISRIFQHEPGGVTINGRNNGLYIKELILGPRGIEKFEGCSLDGSPAIIARVPDRFVLVPVTNRGVTYAPPEKFLGADLEDQTPLGLATVVLEFMVIFFSNAEELLIPS